MTILLLFFFQTFSFLLSCFFSYCLSFLVIGCEMAAMERDPQIERLAEKKLGMDRDQVLKTPMWKLVKQLRQEQQTQAPTKPTEFALIRRKPSPTPSATPKAKPERSARSTSSTSSTSTTSKALISMDRELRHVKEMKVPNIKDDDIGYIVNLFAEYKHVRQQSSKEYSGLQLLEDDPDFGPSDIAYAQKELMGNTVKLEELKAQIMAAMVSYGKFVERRNHKEKLLAESGQFPVSMIEHWKRQAAIRQHNIKMFQQQFVPFLKASRLHTKSSTSDS